MHERDKVYKKFCREIDVERRQEYYEKYKIKIINCQFGFWANHSTNHALISMTEQLETLLDSKHIVAGVYIDLENFSQYESGGTFFVGFIIEYLEKLNAIILIIYSSRPFNVVCEHQVFVLRVLIK